MILENLKGKEILLASKSPRRHYLLDKLGIEFKVVNDLTVDESYPAEIKPEEVPSFLAKRKADVYYEKLKNNSILITADTIVLNNNEILNKPQNKDKAYEMLEALSGSKHVVITGVCIRSAQKDCTFNATSNVWFTELSDREIQYYINKYKPYDKAGAYGIQEWIGYIGVEKIEGSFFNVMGLPVQKLYRELKRF